MKRQVRNRRLEECISILGGSVAVIYAMHRSPSWIHTVRRQGGFLKTTDMGQFVELCEQHGIEVRLGDLIPNTPNLDPRRPPSRRRAVHRPTHLRQILPVPRLRRRASPLDALPSAPDDPKD